jgi:alpha-1,6-mannosyltransferase
MKKGIFLILSGLLIELFYILYRLINVNPAQTVIKYMIIFAAGFVVMVFIFHITKEQESSRFFFLMVLVFSLVFGLTLVSTPPDQSDDIYRYIWDGKLQYFGINPYSYAPDDPALNPYHSDILPSLMNFPEIKTIYPPVAQLVFRLSYTLFGESLTGMKFLFLLAALGSICFFYRILKEREGEVRWLLFFAWNPMFIMETAVNGHLDILMVFFLLMSLWLFYKNRLAFSGIALACAILSKLIPVILLPVFFFFFLSAKNAKNAKAAGGRELKGFLSVNLAFFMPMFLTIAAFYAIYYESAQNMFLTAINYSSKWFFNNPLFMAILGIVGKNQTAHLVSFFLFTAVYLVILTRPIPLEKKSFYVIAAFVLINPTIHPWYLIILLALLCIHRSTIVVFWSGFVVISYIVVYRFKLTGTWKDSWFIMFIEYFPLVILFINNFIRKKDNLEVQ